MNNNNTTALAEPQKVSVKELLNDGEISYITEGNTEIVLTQKIIRSLIKVPQDAPPPTDAQILTFAYTCIVQGLNPYLQECWLVWMKSQGWTPLVAAQSRVRKAQAQSDYRGYEWGWITSDGTRQPARLESKATGKDDIIGVWGSVLRENKTPYYHEIFADEYPPKASQKRLTMLLKINRDQTHKFAYADKMGNLMTENEARYVNNDVVTNSEPRSVALLTDAQDTPESPQLPPESTEAKPQALSVEEAEENAEDKLRDWAFKCLNPKCGILFDEPGGQGKDPLCPKCLTSKVKDLTKK